MKVFIFDLLPHAKNALVVEVDRQEAFAPVKNSDEEGVDCPRTARDAITALQMRRDWIWISGNHDPALPSDLGGVVASEVMIGPIAFRHEPTGAAGEIAGHLHPKARVTTRGRSMERRCFACDGERAVMPAFGAYTGGLNIRDRAFAAVFGARKFSAHLLGGDRHLREDGELVVLHLGDSAFDVELPRLPAAREIELQRALLPEIDHAQDVAVRVAGAEEAADDPLLVERQLDARHLRRSRLAQPRTRLSRARRRRFVLRRSLHTSARARAIRFDGDADRFR